MPPEKIIVFRRSDSLSQGAYQVAQSDGRRATAKIMCPKCSLPLSLAGHTIGQDGYVQEGVACPCDWKAYIKLEGWGS
jgi:hypothetical protein